MSQALMPRRQQVSLRISTLLLSYLAISRRRWFQEYIGPSYITYLHKILKTDNVQLLQCLLTLRYACRSQDTWRSGELLY